MLIHMMNTIYRSREQFQNEVCRHRSSALLTVKELAQKAGMSASLVSAFEQGDKPVSSGAAVKLADAFKLSGAVREDFLLLAAATRRKDRVVAYARELSAEIMNFVPRALKKAGIDFAKIESSKYSHNVDGEGKSSPDRLEVVLGDGKKVVCSLSVSVSSVS
jgi:transcriptional regulator with XRE-family HTH domain